MEDPHNLTRFLSAQESIYETALAELRAGQKRSHWMWFIFPQLRGLGRSATALHYGITGRQEAAAYRAHPVLAGRLDTCTRAVLVHVNSSAESIFGFPDTLKFRSSMTLFAAVDGEGSPFEKALELFYDGEPDAVTLELLEEAPGV